MIQRVKKTCKRYGKSLKHSTFNSSFIIWLQAKIMLRKSLCNNKKVGHNLIN